MGIAAVAGIMPVFAVLSSGLASGFLCWAGVAILAFLLLPDKFLALLFGAMFGLYPVLKGVIERLRKLPLEYLLKLAFFNASLTVIYLTMKASVLSSLPTALNVVWVLYLVGNVVFLVYDFGLSRLISFFMARLGRRRGVQGEGEERIEQEHDRLWPGRGAVRGAHGGHRGPLGEQPVSGLLCKAAPQLYLRGGRHPDPGAVCYFPGQSGCVRQHHEHRGRGGVCHRQ